MSKQDIYYCYTKKVYMKEHLLMANEIAQMFNILSRNNKPATNFISAYLQAVTSKIDDYEQYYYTTRYGDTKVYSQKTYIPAMKGLIEKLRPHTVTEITINDKKYNIKFGGFTNENI